MTAERRKFGDADVADANLPTMESESGSGMKERTGAVITYNLTTSTLSSPRDILPVAHSRRHSFSSQPDSTIGTALASNRHPATFKYFGKLPLELRDLIWKESLPNPRVVEIVIDPRREEWVSPRESRHETCGMLLACSESRKMFLDHYKALCPYRRTEHLKVVAKIYARGAKGKFERLQAYANSSKFSEHKKPIPQVCYISPSIDTLYIGPQPKMFGSFVSTFPWCQKALRDLNDWSAIANIRHLAVDKVEYIYGGDFNDADELSFLKDLTKLETLTVCLGDMGMGSRIRDKRLIQGSGESLPSPIVTLVVVPNSKWLQKHAHWALLDKDGMRELFKERNEEKIRDLLPMLKFARVLRGGIDPRDSRHAEPMFNLKRRERQGLTNALSQSRTTTSEADIECPSINYAYHTPRRLRLREESN
ncbi:hypothetical protein BKA64DRAFT_701460 [Cadophora sp. MPI-SDFR-AT-0126]|nr:hypothetical protein BKA64DRAFT_701460 [Leotiomycetes sp. MPI-SDFR-AT-0126]